VCPISARQCGRGSGGCDQDSALVLLVPDEVLVAAVLRRTYQML